MSKAKFPPALSLRIEEIAEAIDHPVDKWRHQCHGVSLRIVKARLLPDARVARGVCSRVGGQHSWVVYGGYSPYDDEAYILDPTMWSWQEPEPEPFLWWGRMLDGVHRPFGYGSIWEYGRPVHAGGPTIALSTDVELSAEAQKFLDILGPLDRIGWSRLANAPVGGMWPAADILGAMWETTELCSLVPIDVIGMVTDINPAGLYLPGEEADGATG